MFSATLFDFNGVLVDDEAVHLAAFRDVLGPMGVVLSDEDYTARYLGFDDIGAFRAILADHGRPAEGTELAALVEAKRPFYRRRAEQDLVVFRGAAEVVKRAASRGPVGIVSGALRDEIAFALDKMGVQDCISFVVSAEDTKRCKPDPEGYQLGLAALAGARAGARSEDPRRTLVIEDSLAGVEAAKAAGLVCLAVTHSYPEKDLRVAGADGVVAHIADIDDRVLATLASRLT